MKLLQEKVAVITGVNSGIGRRTAELFAQQGAKIVGVDIRTDRMEELKTRVLPVRCPGRGEREDGLQAGGEAIWPGGYCRQYCRRFQ